MRNNGIQQTIIISSAFLSLKLNLGNMMIIMYQLIFSAKPVYIVYFRELEYNQCLLRGRSWRCPSLFSSLHPCLNLLHRTGNMHWLAAPFHLQSPQCHPQYVPVCAVSHNLEKPSQHSVLPRNNSRHVGRVWFGRGLWSHQSFWSLSFSTSKKNLF